MGILICGLNGAGKSTLGRLLADQLSCPFIDSEDLYFSGTTYTAPRSREEAVRILEERTSDGNFVFAAVRGEYGPTFLSRVDTAVLIELPRRIRLQRVRDRSFRRFGERMLPDGDLYEQEQSWFRMVESRPEDYVRTWLDTFPCRLIRVDGMLPPEENLKYVLSRLAGSQQERP